MGECADGALQLTLRNGKRTIFYLVIMTASDSKPSFKAQASQVAKFVYRGCIPRKIRKQILYLHLARVGYDINVFVDLTNQHNELEDCILDKKCGGWACRKFGFCRRFSYW